MKNYYRTKDLPESSYIWLKGVQLLRIDEENGTCWFIFEDRDIAEELANEFWSGSAQVSARKYFNSMMRLKNRVFSLKSNVYEKTSSP